MILTVRSRRGVSADDRACCRSPTAEAAALDAVLRRCTCTSRCRPRVGRVLRLLPDSLPSARPAGGGPPRARAAAAAARHRRRGRRRRRAAGHVGPAGVVRAVDAASRRAPRRWKCTSPPSSSPGTCTTRDRTGRFGPVRDALIGPANPVGIDRTDPAAKDDIGAAQHADRPDRPPGDRHADRARRHSRVHDQRDARQAGRDAGIDGAHVVHADRRRARSRSAARSSAASATTACAATCQSFHPTRGTRG